MSVHRAKKALEAMQNGKYFRVRLLLEGSLIGIIVGFIISLFRFLLEKSEQLRPMLYQYLTLENWLYIVGYFLGLACVAFVLYKLVQIEPMASGSGIPQIKGILLGRMHMNWLRVLVYKFVGGVLAIGSGLSLGREGPSVQLGATIGQGISRMRKSSRLEERFLLTSGAGAGLAAAFNAPLAGVIFCLEELQKNFSPMVLIPAIAAALAATLVGQEFFGNGPVFHITELAMIPLGNYGILICLSIFIGFLGRLFNKSLLRSMNIYEKYITVKWLKKPMIPLLIAGLIGFVLPQILGGGNQLVDLLVENDYPISLIFILFLGKFIFTMICFASGVPGGIFLPMLVLGALGGSLFGHLAIAMGLLDPMYMANIIVVAMAGYFSAVVKAPVTGSILIMEMTNSFEHMLALIFVSMIAYLVADLLNGKPVYDELLERSLQKTKKFQQMDKYKRILLELVVENGAAIDGAIIRKINWPKCSLVVNIKRGEQEISPAGNTRIQAGDYLYIFANDVDIDQFKQMAMK